MDGAKPPEASAAPTAERFVAFDVLRAYLQARESFTEEDLRFIQARFIPSTLKSQEYLQRAGTVARYAAFVARGCLRTFVIDAEGNEHIVQFAPETWWVADSISLANGTPAQYFIDAIEDTDLLLIEPTAHDAIEQAVPAYAASFRRGLQRHVAAKDERIVKSMSATAQERYLDFLRTYPSLATRVPQRMLASYLGVSPETISRIRGRLARGGV
jgi:CRP-like cAMP-binding protein